MCGLPWQIRWTLRGHRPGQGPQPPPAPGSGTGRGAGRAGERGQVRVPGCPSRRGRPPSPACSTRPGSGRASEGSSPAPSCRCPCSRQAVLGSLCRGPWRAGPWEGCACHGVGSPDPVSERRVGLLRAGRRGPAAGGEARSGRGGALTLCCSPGRGQGGGGAAVPAADHGVPGAAARVRPAAGAGRRDAGRRARS